MSRHDCQRRNVARANVGEVALVHGGDGHDGQALANCDHGCIRTAQPPVGIAPHQFRHAPHVAIYQADELETVTRPGADAVEECGFSGRAKILVD